MFSGNECQHLMTRSAGSSWVAVRWRHLFNGHVCRQRVAEAEHCNGCRDFEPALETQPCDMTRPEL